MPRESESGQEGKQKRTELERASATHERGESLFPPAALVVAVVASGLVVVVVTLERIGLLVLVFVLAVFGENALPLAPPGELARAFLLRGRLNRRPVVLCLGPRLMARLEEKRWAIRSEKARAAEKGASGYAQQRARGRRKGRGTGRVSGYASSGTGAPA